MPGIFSSSLRTLLLGAAILAVPMTAFCFQSAPAKEDGINLNSKAPIKQGPSIKAEAYYHFTVGHMYEEMASAYGNRTDYVNKAIDNYRLALEAEGALKNNPNDLNARRVLARIYTQQIGDSQTNKIDQGMLHKAVEQYQL